MVNPNGLTNAFRSRSGWLFLLCPRPFATIASMPDDDRLTMVPCFFCGTSFQMSHHIYRGKHIRRYGIDVCEGCYAGNWDGWAPHFEAKLRAHLERHRLPIPDRNEKGWLPRN